MSAEEPRDPEKTFRSGRMSAAIWSKEVTEDGRTFNQYSVRVQKRFKDKDDNEWKSTPYYFKDELPQLVLVATKAFEYVAMALSSNNGGDHE